MGQPKRVLLERCSKCYGSPKAYKMEQNQAMLKLFSEYQTAYKQWPWQPVRQSLKPESNKGYRERAKGQMERKSTYGIDYVPIPSPKKSIPKKPKAELTCPCVNMDASTTYKMEFFAKVPEVQNVPTGSHGTENMIQPSKHIPFHGDSIYMVSYPGYDNQMMAQCQQRPVKKKDNIEIPTSSESEKNAQSTAMGDFIRHETYDRPTAVRPQENNQPSSEPVQGCTEYKDSFNQKLNDPHLCRTVKADKSPSPAMAVSTAMADFTWPTGFEPQKACHPPKSNHFISAKFDGTTTFNMAYKPWTVTPYELPIWAKKPKYKRPTGGMIVNSLYMHDYTDPKMIHPPKPIKPKTRQKNTIMKGSSRDMTSNCVSTYITDYKPWEGYQPPESYRVMEVYTPPREKMNFETNQRSHFKGEYATKRKPCRHVSEHRDLNDNMNVPFITTYNENFQNPRPKSSPSEPSTSLVINKSRCFSAKATIPTPSNDLKRLQTNVNRSAASSNRAKSTQVLRIHTPSVVNKSISQISNDNKKDDDKESLVHEE